MDEHYGVAEFIKNFTSRELKEYVFVGSTWQKAQTYRSIGHISSTNSLVVRLAEKLESTTGAASTARLLRVPGIVGGDLAFGLASFVEPARDTGQGLRFNFLATYLVAGIPFAPVPLRIQEDLRSSGLAVETIVPAMGDRDTRRRCFPSVDAGTLHGRRHHFIPRSIR
jgi:hypothetical protein